MRSTQSNGLPSVVAASRAIELLPAEAATSPVRFQPSTSTASAAATIPDARLEDGREVGRLHERVEPDAEQPGQCDAAEHAQLARCALAGIPRERRQSSDERDHPGADRESADRPEAEAEHAVLVLVGG